MDLNAMIKRNLFFKVDFNSKYKKGKKGIKQTVKFFLIGVIPVVIEYTKGKKERSVINIPIEVEQDPHLRLLHGVRYESLKKVQAEIKKRFKKKVNYKPHADKVAEKAQGAIKAIIDDGKFMGKEINSIMIINIGKKEYAKSQDTK